MNAVPRQAIEALKSWSLELREEMERIDQRLKELEEERERLSEKLEAIETLAPKSAGLLEIPTEQTSLSGMGFRDAILLIIKSAKRPLFGSADVEQELLKAGYEDESGSKLPLKTRISGEISKLIASDRLRRTEQGIVPR